MIIIFMWQIKNVRHRDVLKKGHSRRNVQMDWVMAKLEERCQKENRCNCPLKEDENLNSNSSKGMGRKGVAEVGLVLHSG